ncbi:MAG: hypothetical protein APF84_09775 [Gracilibacter sp. BRH_c7a]|nr:MAG: hypothetical protein APF84_09775 [Gracilibacter sp. BRH_c7a]
MKKGVFREVSLQRLSSPEQLDQLMSVTSPRAWLALLGVAAILLTALMWGIFGSIPNTTSGEGILIKSGGVLNITHSSGGQIRDIKVEAGDIVKRGDVVARIDRHELVEQITALEEQLEQVRISEVESEVKQIKDKELNDQINKLRTELEIESTIVAPEDGRVIEVDISMGEIVQPGMHLISIEREGDTVRDLEVVMYVPAEEGKQILPGMTAHISPTTVKKEEYGFMIGRVISVSEFPETAQGMMVTLGSQELVARLSRNSAPIEVRVELITDRSTVSGYKWSSLYGPPITIDTGTLCTGTVTISSQPPIRLVIPDVKKYLMGN